ncbi:MFS transporter [Azorhizobium doebereinerae]|uniref:MFS transporter n=1 Tax=Azorhizobium doebereinerae TaxID=281091 RepID=UPI0003FCBA86|nr:MFS transporter [Azorhizobium doebereinerae]
MAISTAYAAQARSRARYWIVFVIFAVTVLNYADRAIISIAGAPLAKEYAIDPVSMGYILSAFSWSYVAAQIPGGWLLDRYGTKWVYAGSIFFWSLFTFMQGWVGFFGAGSAIIALFAFRFAVGIAEAPSFPGNARIVAAWFPTAERGKASAIFNSAQYFAPVLFAPLTAWVTQEFGWRYAFMAMGVIGIVAVAVWSKVIYGPNEHPGANAAELDHIREGGALMEMGAAAKTGEAAPVWGYVRQLLANRMMLGIYLAQYCINVITYFFLTWFPIYLVKDRGMTILKAGMVASLPALCGFIGGVLGGVISDAILRRTGSLTLARKVPIIGGMLLSMSIIGCNYVQTEAFVVGLMALAFFGKGIGSLGWAVVSDTSPKQIGGLSGGLFNTFGNMAGITTPIIIGYIVQGTGSFNGALLFVGLNGFVALAAYLVMVGEIKRVELKTA